MTIKIADVLRMLESESFARWYNGEFEDYITGEEEAPTREQVIAFLVSHLGE